MMPTTFEPRVFVPREEERSILAAFLGRHPDGWCPLTRAPRRVTRRAAPKEGVRFGICDCLAPPIFLKALRWREAFSERWERLSERAASHRELHTRSEILAPHFHVRTETEWIRVYPFWPIDLGSFLALPAMRNLPADIALEILRRVARGLALLEEAGILHRDLKAANILLRSSCLRESSYDRVPVDLFRGTLEVCLADFSDGTAVGTRFWAPPEILAGRPTCWSPLFGWGLLAWNCLTRLPIHKIHSGWVAEASDEIWRDQTPHGAWLRRGILPFVFAATTHDEGERRALLAGALDRSEDLQTPARSLAEALELVWRRPQAADRVETFEI